MLERAELCISDERTHFMATAELFTAVEQDDIGTVRAMLTRTHGAVDINSENLDDLTSLDVAVLLGHDELARLLLQNGAQENPRLTSLMARRKKLKTLGEQASVRLAEYQVLVNKGGSTQNKEFTKQFTYWENRVHTYKKMRTNLDALKVPAAPSSVVVSVASATSLLVQIEPPSRANKVVTTKYKGNRGGVRSNYVIAFE